jgi:hypothetical protein
MSLTRLSAALPLTGVLAVAFAVNWPTLHDYFHGDDYLAFVDMVSKPPLRHMWEVLTFKDSDVYWRPLGELYYLLIWKVFGLNEVAFHLANVSVFLVTLVLLYRFCLGAGLGKHVGLCAAAVLTLFPNHVVSVSWVTNGPRLVAVMFALASLVLLQKAIATRRLRFEVLAVFSFALAGLADETALALAPLPVLYSLMFDHGASRIHGRTLVRTFAFGTPALFLVPLQFLATKGDPSYGLVGFGWHMPQHFWALTSKLVLPSHDGISFSDIQPEQWTAGAAAIAALGVALLFGSNRMKFLAAWTVLAILPFTIWVMPLAPARYIYMAAVPFAVVVSWASVALFERLSAATRAALATRGTVASTALAGATLVVLAFLGSVGAQMTRERDRTFASDTATYRVLADDLKAAAPHVPKGSRIVIYYGIWTGLTVWPDAVAKTIYKDRAVRVINVPRGQVESGGPGRSANDIVLFYTGRGFIRAAPQKNATTAN